MKTMRSRDVAAAVGACLVLAAGGWARAADADGPTGLIVTHRAELGPAFVELHYVDRWCGPAVTREGHLLFFYSTPDRQIRYVLSRDGRTFAEPVEVARGIGPSVALDAGDNIHLAYKNDSGKVGMRKLMRTGGGRWDVGEETTPFAAFGGGIQQLPTLLILPGSDRIWCTYNFVPRDLNSLPGDQWTKGKPRTDPVMTYSDDGGRSWAEPVYIGSDSGDIGTGVVILRSYRGRPAWFWAFWDCAPPAWGYFDGSRARPLREFFPHSSRRTASWHPWDVLEDGSGRMVFATGLSHKVRGQLYKVFDGREWSDDVFLSGEFGKMVLVNDDKRTFCLVSEGGEPRGTRIVAYELDGTKAVRRGQIYKPGEGRFIHRFYVAPRNRQAPGYFPLFLIEEAGRKTGQDARGRDKWVYDDPKLVYLRVEAGPMDPKAAAAEAARGVPDPATIPQAAANDYKPMPINDSRTEPRTDVPKDRKIVRVGKRWVIVYADDNPGRLLAAEIVAGKVGKPVVLIDRPAWGRFQCSAAADGDDALVAIADGVNEPRMVRLVGISNWDAAPPRVDVRRDIPAAPTSDVWPTLSTSVRRGFMASAAEPWIGHHFSVVSDGERIDVLYAPRASYLGRKIIGHVRCEKGKWSKPLMVSEGVYAEGLSLCGLGGGRLLCVYSARNPRAENVPAGVEGLQRFTYTLRRQVFDGNRWGAAKEDIPWPEIPVRKPKNWEEFNRSKGVVYVPETGRGVFPTLPASAAGCEEVPVAWMVPGFDCVTRYWFDPDRGGLLLAAEIRTND
ncbi:MAG TPA: sialidase family protein [Phycisphaerae bacterium]|nr:sialidase family protein [Phycisphaerae bacterium]